MRRLTMLLLSLSWPWAAWADDSDPAEGLYGRLCLPCHGEQGDGLGPAAALFDPPPADFTGGAFAYRSTPPGTAPLLADVERTIARGVPGTWMPAWEGTLTSAQVRALAQRVLTFVRPALPVARPVPLPPASMAGDATRGAAVWLRAGCGECHGPAGAGDGPAAATLRTDDGRPAVPYDLRRTPFRGGAGPSDLARSIAVGLEGTPMPGYRDALRDQDLADLAVFLRTGQDRATLAATADGGALPPLQDGEAIATSLLPAVPDGPAARGFHRFPIPRQGTPPAHLTPAETSLDPRQCGRCHAEQFQAWGASLHARTHGPGFTGQMPSAERRFAYECHRCHAPMTEQLPFFDVEGAMEDNPHEVPGLADTGVGCAVCHLRGHVRHGPPVVESSRLAPLPSYPRRVLGKFERGDFCLPCHQHSMDAAVAGRPPLDTVREWMASPYFRRGVQCQSCHMPERAHTWKGIHDPATVRQGLRFEASLERRGADVEVTVRLTNAAAGHMLPTTVTPVILVHAMLVDAAGAPIDGSARILDRVERSLYFRDGVWHERHDTRIPPGRTRTSRVTLRATGVADAVRVEVEVRPDHAYEGIYRALLRPAQGRAREALRVAYTRAVSSPFVAFTTDLPLAGDPRPAH